MTEQRKDQVRLWGFALAFLAQFGLIVWHSARTVAAIEQLQRDVASQTAWQHEAQLRLEADALNIELLKARVTAHERRVP